MTKLCKYRNTASIIIKCKHEKKSFQCFKLQIYLLQSQYLRKYGLLLSTGFHNLAALLVIIAKNPPIDNEDERALH